MTVEIYANGVDDGSGTHISVFVRILRGSYDTELKWPFVGNVTVTLLNQLQDYNHHQEMIQFTNTDNSMVGYGFGFPAYISRNHPSFLKLYLKDDTLYFRVSVNVPASSIGWRVELKKLNFKGNVTSCELDNTSHVFYADIIGYIAS